MIYYLKFYVDNNKSIGDIFKYVNKFLESKYYFLKDEYEALYKLVRKFFSDVKTLNSLERFNIYDSNYDFLKKKLLHKRNSNLIKKIFNT